MIIFEWLNDQLLKMEWLSNLVKLIVEQGFGLNIEERLGGSIHFFIYDVVKIFILLAVLIFILIIYLDQMALPIRTNVWYNGYKR